MTDTTSKELELEQNEVDLDDLESSKHVCRELLSNLSILSKSCEKSLRNCPKMILN